jgi:hypothetical protein
MRDDFVHPSRRKKRRISYAASPAPNSRIARRKAIPRAYEIMEQGHGKRGFANDLTLRGGMF